MQSSMLGVEIHPDNRVGSSLPTFIITNKNNNKCHIARLAENTTALTNSIKRRNVSIVLTRLEHILILMMKTCLKYKAL